MSRLRLPLLCVALLTVAGCTLIGPDPSTGRQPEPVDGTLAENRARWEASGIDTYTLVYRVTCFCAPDALGPFRVEVEKGEVVRASGPSGDLASEEVWTAEGLFELLEQAYERDAADVRVQYDQATGLPVDLFIDYDRGVADEEYGVIVQSIDS